MWTSADNKREGMRMTMPEIGMNAPHFSLSNQDGNIVNTKDYLGQFVVIYFYPKAMTSGCTTQACGLRDAWQELSDMGVAVFGISPDQPKLLHQFIIKENLPFDLLSDADHAVAELYGTWQEKAMYGRKYMGMARVSFLVNPSGTVIHVLHKVSTSTHAADVIKIIRDYTGKFE